MLTTLKGSLHKNVHVCTYVHVHIIPIHSRMQFWYANLTSLLINLSCEICILFSLSPADLSKHRRWPVFYGESGGFSQDACCALQMSSMERQILSLPAESKQPIPLPGTCVAGHGSNWLVNGQDAITTDGHTRRQSWARDSASTQGVDCLGQISPSWDCRSSCWPPVYTPIIKGAMQFLVLLRLSWINWQAINSSHGHVRQLLHACGWHATERGARKDLTG